MLAARFNLNLAKNDLLCAFALPTLRASRRMRTALPQERKERQDGLGQVGQG
jgi:hypothetical protein